MNKQKLKKAFKFVGIKVLGAFIFVAVAGTSIWALAAFTEPTTTPGNSVQDWAKNIMGANNSDNAFDSGDVVANSDGSIVERLEALENKQGVTAISARSVSLMDHTEAVEYCFNLVSIAEVANTGSGTITTYTDWKLGTINEMAIFGGNITGDDQYLWTNTLYEVENSIKWITLRLNVLYSQQDVDNAYYTNSGNGLKVRCVR